MIAAVVTFLLLRSTWAIDPDAHLSQYGHAVWRVKDGYFPGRLLAATQTTDGYIWIGTAAGLLRFDGVTFVPWVPPQDRQLPSPQIVSLLGASDGSLWIGTSTGLSHLRNRDLTNFDLHGYVGTIFEDSDHSVWVVYSKAPGQTPLCHISDAAIRCYEQKDGIPYPAEGGLIRDDAGNFWLNTRQGIARWRPDSASVYNVKALQSFEGSDAVEAIAFGEGHSLLVGIALPGRGLGLQQFMPDSATWAPYRKPTLDGSKVTAHALLADHEGTLWIGTLQQGIFRIHGQQVEHFGSADGLSGDSVQSLFEDREGNLWVITSKGVDLFHNLRVLSFSTGEGVATEQVESVLASRDGTVWVGGAESLSAIRNDHISSIRIGKDLPGEQVGALFEDHAGHLWVGIDENLFLYENQHFKPLKRPDGSPIGSVKSVTEDRDNNIWVSTWHGAVRELLRIRDLRVQEHFSAPQLPTFRQAIADSRGNLWLSPLSGGLARFNNGNVEALPFAEVKDSLVEQLFVAADGSVLGATPSGVIAWNNGNLRILSTKSGLPCDAVHGIVNDERGNLWLNLQCGIVEVQRPELERWWEKSARLQPRLFDSLDGAQAGRAFWNAAARSTDGRLWFANGTLLQMINPARTSLNEVVPKVQVEQIIADRTTYSLHDGIKVPPLTRDLEVDYTAASFSEPQKVLFRYKLEGRDNNWTDAGNRRQAFYSDLRPGDYHFRVIACNSDGVWNEAGASVGFSILPAFHQTMWFRIACATAFVFFLWATYQFRIRRLHRQFAIGLEARVNERTRIARELHDTVLQSLHGLLMSFQRAANLLPERPVEAKQRLEDAIDQAAQAISEGREAVQGLRSSTVLTNDLALAIQTLGEELAAKETTPNPPLFSVAVEGTVRGLNPILRDDVYRIAGEALRNAFHHAQARRIEVEIHYDERELRLRVRDDGKGIGAQLLSNKGRPGHWGLEGMRERAKVVGGHLEIWSELDSGTEIELRIPASLVYLSSAASNREKARQ